MKRKIVTILTMFCLVVSTPITSYAAGNMAQPMAAGGSKTAQPYYENTTHLVSELKIDGNTAYCNAEVTAKKVCYINVVMRLQRQEGSSWHTVASWVGSSTNGTKSMTKSFTLSTRGTYRVYAIFNVGGEELTYTSLTRKY